MLKNKRLTIFVIGAGCGIILLLYFLFAVGDTIPEEKFTNFYIDFIIAQDSVGADIAATKNILHNLYKKYDTDSIAYYNTITYLSEDPKRWESFFDNVIKTMEAKNKKAIDSLPQEGKQRR